MIKKRIKDFFLIKSNEYIETDWPELRPAGKVAIGKDGKTCGWQVDEYGLYSEPLIMNRKQFELLKRTYVEGPFTEER